MATEPQETARRAITQSPDSDRRKDAATTRLRVLSLCHEYPPIGGGAGVVCAELSRHYARQGHDVTVLTMGYGDLPQRENCDGVTVQRIPCGRRRREMASPWEALRWASQGTRVARQLHREVPFDVTHAHFIMPGGMIAGRLKRSEDLPFLVTPHGSDVPGYSRERLKLAHILAHPWWRRICRQADWIVSPSLSLEQMIEDRVDHCSCTVIPNGFLPGRFKDGPKERRILLCCRLIQRKGVQYFLQAVESLPLPDWQVDIVGDGPMYRELAEMAQRCRVPVKMHGWLDGDSSQLAELYSKAMLFVLPSDRENFSIALMEAMSAGCAIIATDASGNPEVLGTCGYLVPPRDVKSLREAIRTLTANEEACRALGSQAKARVMEEFDWKIVGQRYLNLLESLSQRRASR